ncbi:hypothetical protein CVT26_010462 [Gymnopilus dilepis]|uniref:JmjC domain-containing protein n=1 Tax=Gymnopilus dilepis TaxID=231916 RepID=A0A409Y0E6_9AGAR|nr:hypothetical protein CVT26_010462 [Gymnopilus dilepis]
MADPEDILQPLYPENHWIADLYREWSTSPISCVKATQTEGRAALETLAAYGRLLPSRPTTDSKLFEMQARMTAKEPVTVADMVGDLISSEHFTAVDMNSTREPKSIRKEEVLGSLVHFGNQNGEECISVLNVAAHTAQRRGVRYPADISPKKTDILHWNGTPQTRLDWVICPRGAITGSHIDEYTMRSWIWHWKGKKLWFAWPGSATNLEKYLSYLFNSTEEMNIARAIQEFENMEVLLLDDSDEGFS